MRDATRRKAPGPGSSAASRRPSAPSARPSTCKAPQPQPGPAAKRRGRRGGFWGSPPQRGRLVTLKPGASISATLDSRRERERQRTAASKKGVESVVEPASGRLGPLGAAGAPLAASFESLQNCLRPVSLAFPSVAHVSHLAEVLLLAEGPLPQPLCRSGAALPALV